MNAVPRSILDGFNESINALADAARARFDAGFALLVQSLADPDGLIPPEHVAELRRGTIELLDDIGGAANELAAVLASESYDEARRASVGSALGFTATASDVSAANDGAVRALVQKVVDTGDPSAFGELCGQRLDYSARKSAGMATLECGKRDPRKPRFARVPTGAETCSFCIMLASRGAVYKSELTAGAMNHYHPKCDCKIVPDFGGGIEGYDPEEYFQPYINARARLGEFPSTKEIIREMDRDQRAAKRDMEAE